jgi:hypothetical protein
MFKEIAGRFNTSTKSITSWNVVAVVLESAPGTRGEKQKIPRIESVVKINYK